MVERGLAAAVAVSGDPQAAGLYLAILNKQAQIKLKDDAELGFLPPSRSRVQADRGANGVLALL